MNILNENAATLFGTLRRRSPANEKKLDELIADPTLYPVEDIVHRVPLSLLNGLYPPNANVLAQLGVVLHNMQRLQELSTVTTTYAKVIEALQFMNDSKHLVVVDMPVLWSADLLVFPLLEGAAPGTSVTIVDPIRLLETKGAGTLRTECTLTAEIYERGLTVKEASHIAWHIILIAAGLCAE